jgi:GT2 family glycosyltransferase
MISIRIVSYNKSHHLLNAVKSISQSYIEVPYEILIFEGGTNKENQRFFLGIWDELRLNHIKYFCGLGNFGLAKGLNFLHTKSHKDTKYIVEANEDMFFHPLALYNLLNALQGNPTLGLACSLMTNGGLYPKTNPQPQDLDDFTNRNKTLPEFKLGFGASNMPWMMTKEFYEELRTVDVWSDRPPLFLNEYPGIWDESIDTVMGWYVDHDLHNRARSIKQVAIVGNALVYHYDHCSGEELDKSTPGWTKRSSRNYYYKWGGLEKDRDLIKKPWKCATHNQ